MVGVRGEGSDPTHKKTHDNGSLLQPPEDRPGGVADAGLELALEVAGPRQAEAEPEAQQAAGLAQEQGEGENSTPRPEEACPTPGGLPHPSSLPTPAPRLDQSGSCQENGPEPRAQSPEPGAQSPEPGAQSPEPRARLLSKSSNTGVLRLMEPKPWAERLMRGSRSHRGATAQARQGERSGLSPPFLLPSNPLSEPPMGQT